MKTFFYGLGFCGILSATIATVYFYQAEPAYSLPQRELSTLEESLANDLKADLGQSHMAHDWVQVKDCAITFRHQTPSACSNGDELSFDETRLDLREIATIDYFESPNPDSEYRSAITFEYVAEVKQKFNAAKEQMWDFLGTRKGAPESMWSEHVIAAEQRILKSMEIDTLGSYELSGDCDHKDSYRRLPNATHTLQLKGRDREVSKKLRRYLLHCASN